MRLTDEAIGDAVHDQLFKDPAVPAYRIEVAARDGALTLGHGEQPA